ncbi:MAG: radical SAM protein [Firmicutes bacterium]|nr:radical SAM protein [Bacillota bacterium]
MNTFQEFVSEEVIRGAIRMAAKDLSNLGRLINLLSKLAREENHKRNLEAVSPHLSNPDSNWYQLIDRVAKTTNPKILETLLLNFIVKAGLKGIPVQHRKAKEIGVSVPFALLVDPTSACNLSCTGCWAGDYQKNDNLSFETLDRIFTEAKELGIYFVVLSGGEPLVRRNDIIALAQKHPEMAFHLFTNGTLIDEELVSELQQVGNVTMAISLEGFEKRTDERRGKGVFQRIMDSMDLLREGGVPFGYSVTYTRLNTEEVGSEEFVDFMVKKGAVWGWYFTYIPIGKDVDLDYMATPAQRKYIYNQIHSFRKSKPILLVDFWNDGPYSNGCIAGGKRYLHINAAGDVEPCAFIHYATCNIEEVSLVEALQSPLFKAYQRRQPFNENLLRPCPLLDNPNQLPEIVKESGATPTQCHNKVDPELLAHELQGYAKEWDQISRPLWERDFPNLASGKEKVLRTANSN